MKVVRPSAGIVVGVNSLAWMYDKSLEWARAMLEQWEDEQKRGGPRRVFRAGRRLHTTMPVLHAYMPPGKDLALYRRVEAVEDSAIEAHCRIDRIDARVAIIEHRERRRASA